MVCLLRVGKFYHRLVRTFTNFIYRIYFKNNQNILTNILDTSAIDTFMLDSFGELGIANKYNWKLQMQWLISTDKRNQF